MLFSFPEDARWNADMQSLSSASVLANTKGWCECRATFSGALSMAR